ncbi:MAG: DNA-processing protein DprA, partial [Spirochaetales bacterium]
RGAVSARSTPTFAVLGSGIDRIYPAANRTLAASMLTGSGGLISEYPPGFPVRRYHFPERNRIIAVLARWVLIVQAPERSGALITADYALDAGRELLVHTVGVSSAAACVGTRALADDGAQAVSGVADLLPESSCSSDTAGRNAADAVSHELPEVPNLSREPGSASRHPRSGSAHPSDISSLLARRLDRELDIFEPEPCYG